jgi:hypothetical protein
MVVHWKLKLGFCKLTDCQYEPKPFTKAFRGFGIGHDFGNWLPLQQDAALTLNCLTVIMKGLATPKGGREE